MIHRAQCRLKEAELQHEAVNKEKNIQKKKKKKSELINNCQAQINKI